MFFRTKTSFVLNKTDEIFTEKRISFSFYDKSRFFSILKNNKLIIYAIFFVLT